MSRVTPACERLGTPLRDGLLVVAADLLAARGFAGLRMADVASRTGVSRQTVYNEFGNKAGLVQAVAVHRTAEYLVGVEQRLGGADRPFDGMRDALAFMLEQASKDRLITSVVTGADAEDLLPFLTTRGLPVLLPAVAIVAEHLRRRWPDLPAERLRLAAETIVRLVLSHLLMPSAPPEQAVEAMLAVARAVLPEEG
ncbi:TetR family transcriptional regulator [Umezawaea sp. Da 62-37]|uniref:TetR family transcriptional regulator n=1 Tax=Umezawaea sp. Da 62-37 TaxID=3075927 RepID=UPI0028F6FF0E|nr:TetR family transcriptional regulator [Umezawaea sp. Da 62-37]WNV82031.1 TetR family transcriptional regulator [Umezawaea sp. Da 62-37]